MKLRYGVDRFLSRLEIIVTVTAVGVFVDVSRRRVKFFAARRDGRNDIGDNAVFDYYILRFGANGAAFLLAPTR